MKHLLFAVLGLAVAAAAGAGGSWLWLQNEIHETGPLTAETDLLIEPGSGLNKIARDLEAAAIIRSADVFRIHARLSGFAGDLKAGEYRFAAGIAASDVLAKLVANDVVVRFVTIPEGLTSAQILSIINDADALSGGADTPIAEGTLLPETYAYSRGESRAALIERMATQLDRTVDDLWLNRADDLPLNDKQDAIILASIVEKETAVAEERGRVAAVFINRLKRGMRLQSDPTVAFGVDPTGPLGRPLRRSDLEGETPYNTYKINGLPPGPICHPGRDSLAAVLNPPPSDDLYFVADGSGGHAFAKTLADHNRNVANWRRIQRENGLR